MERTRVSQKACSQVTYLKTVRKEGKKDGGALENAKSLAKSLDSLRSSSRDFLETFSIWNIVRNLKYIIKMPNSTLKQCGKRNNKRHILLAHWKLNICAYHEKNDVQKPYL